MGALFCGSEKLILSAQIKPLRPEAWPWYHREPPLMNQGIAANNANIQLVQAAYHPDYLRSANIMVMSCGPTSPEVNKWDLPGCQKQYLLVQMWQTRTELLRLLFEGGIVTKGNVKIAISTNGQKSHPLRAKRLRQLLKKTIPEDINEMVGELQPVTGIHWREIMNYKVRRSTSLTGRIDQKKIKNKPKKRGFNPLFFSHFFKNYLIYVFYQVLILFVSIQL